MASPWKSMSFDGPIPDLTKPFHIDCPSSTDIFDTPPDTHRFDAPYIYQTTSLSKLKTAQVTVTADWVRQYDQGGLMVVARPKNGTTSRWVKGGVELLDGKPRVGIVAKDTWADWSLTPVLAKDGKTATIIFESEPGKPLWIRLIDDNGEKHPLREVTWWADLDLDSEILVGVYTAKPSSEGELRVNYSNLEVISS